MSEILENVWTLEGHVTELLHLYRGENQFNFGQYYRRGINSRQDKARLPTFAIETVREFVKQTTVRLERLAA